MKKRFMKSVVAIVCIMLAVFTYSGAAVQPCWTYVSTVEGSIDISSLAIASVSASGSAASTQVTKTVCTTQLQKLSGGKWVTLKTWSASSNPHYAVISKKQWAVDHGCSYRLYTELKAYKGDTLLETGSSVANYGYYR